MKKLNGNQDSLASTSYVICGRCKDPVKYALTYKCPYHHTTCLSHVIPWNPSTNSPDIDRVNIEETLEMCANASAAGVLQPEKLYHPVKCEADETSGAQQRKWAALANLSCPR